MLSGLPVLWGMEYSFAGAGHGRRNRQGRVRREETHGRESMDTGQRKRTRPVLPTCPVFPTVFPTPGGAGSSVVVGENLGSTFCKPREGLVEVDAAEFNGCPHHG